MYCHNCGKEISENSNYCFACGVNFSSVVDYNQYGGFWIRFSACIIDRLILLIPLLLIFFLMGENRPIDSPEGLIDLFFELFINISLTWIYTAGMNSSEWQATFGKRFLGLKVVCDRGGRISFGRATGRYFAESLSGIFLGFGYLMVAFSRKKQGLHDKIANTFVIKCPQVNPTIVANQ